MSMDQGEGHGNLANLANFGELGSGKMTLGSLAQSARNKHINQARGALLIIGVLTILAHIGLYAVLMQNAGKPNADPEAVRVAQIAIAIGLGEGVVFFVLGLLTRKYPVPATILGLTLYVADSAIWLANAVGEKTFVSPWIKIIIIFVLVKAVQSAIAYQREIKETAYQADPLA